MSRHEIEEPNRTIVFGWDQPLMSYFLQIHDKTLSDTANPIVWLGADRETSMYELDHLVHVAAGYGIPMGRDIQTVLYLDKDEGR